MPFNLPNSTGAASLTDAATTEAQQKTNLTNLRGFIAEMLGNDSTSRGPARSLLGIDMPTLAFSVGGSAMTIALKSAAGADGSAAAPVSLAFRSATLSSAALLVRQATAALSLVVSSGSTLGMVNGVDSWLYVYALDNSGAIELAISGKYYGAHFIGATTAEGGAGAADSGTTIYSNTARSNVPMRLLYAIRSNQGTAGTWSAVPVESVLAESIGPLGVVSGAAPVYGIRAWVLFDTNRNASGGSDTAATNRLILGSGNVASVLRNALGDFTVTFITAMPDANYALNGSAKAASSSDGAVVWIKDGTTPTASAVNVAVGQTGRSGVNLSVGLESALVSVSVTR